MVVLTLLLKLTLAPALVAAATTVGRRMGHRVGGLVGSLPVVAAPIVLILAIQEGEGYADRAAGAAVLGVVSLVAFCLTYGALAERTGWPVAVAASWAAFGAGTALFSLVRPPAAGAIALLALAVALASWVLFPRVAPEPRSGAGGRSDLPARLVITAAMVLALTAVARGLDAHLAGLLTPFPIITAVLAGFTHREHGGRAARELLGGFTPGLASFGLFFVVLAAGLGPLPAVVAFLLATLSTLAAHTVLILLVRRGVAPTEP